MKEDNASGIKIGLELEFQILDQDGNVCNAAPTILSDPANNGNIVPEGSNSMIEVIAPPSDNLEEMASNFQTEVVNLVNIAEKYGFRLLPSSTIGKDAKPEETGLLRYASKKSVLGSARKNIEYHICGTHVHTDKLPDELLATQYKVKTAMDPAFALMASTPFHAGKNSLEDHRVHIYRNVVFDDFPLQGQLLPHVNNFDEVLERQQATYDHWISLVQKKGFSGDGFNVLNTCWGPVRCTENTIEARGADANLLSRVIALGALYKGVNEFIQQYTPNTVIAENLPAQELFTFIDGKTLRLPSFQQLKAFEKAGINKGIRDPQLNSYLSNVLFVARKGLSHDDQRFLEPFAESLRTGRTFSREIVDFAKKEGIYSTDDLSDSAACSIRRYISDRMSQDLDEFKYN
ncbi:glutamate-cysteine ligase family protein [Thermoproteota archaeon]